MSAPDIISSSLPSLCQKLSRSVQIRMVRTKSKLTMMFHLDLMADDA